MAWITKKKRHKVSADISEEMYQNIKKTNIKFSYLLEVGYQAIIERKSIRQEVTELNNRIDKQGKTIGRLQQHIWKLGDQLDQNQNKVENTEDMGVRE